jgi:hypothetical protein
MGNLAHRRPKTALKAALSESPTKHKTIYTTSGVTRPVVRVRRGQLSGAGVRADLERLSAEETLTPITAALLQRDQLAADLAHLRAIRPLPIAGANDFLGVLQLRLRDEPGMAERASQIQAALPTQLAHALVSMEQQLSGEPVVSPTATDEQEAAAEMAAMLSHLPPEQRAELQVLAQVAPLLQQGVRLLQQPGITAAERGRLASGLENAATQAEAGETADSPWLEAAVALRRVAGWLKGTPAEPGALNEPYRSVITQMLEDTGGE